jgi:hypothetical protein
MSLETQKKEEWRKGIFIFISLEKIRSVLYRDHLADLTITLGEKMDIAFETTCNGEEG